MTVAIGVTATGAMSKHKWGAFHASTDKYVMEYVAGAGVAVRLGDISKTTNSVFSVYCLRDECMLYKPPEPWHSMKTGISIGVNGWLHFWTQE